MKKLIITGLLAMTTAAWAQTTVKVEDAWVRGTVSTQKATGAFMRLTPSANARLVEAQSPVAGVVEIHEMAMEKDVMKMRQIPGLDLAAGRTMEPAVCVPKASGAMQSATAAAEPEEEPPGVCAGSCGLAVAPGWRVANSVVTVLPITTAPAARAAATAAESPRGRCPAQIGDP